MPSKHPETLALHAGWRADPATHAVAVPIYQTTSYQFHEHRARREPVRAEGARQHLHPHHEPDQRRAGAAHGGARGRRGGAGGRVRPGGLGLRGPEPRPRRRQHRLLHRPLRRHLEPVRQHAEGPGHRGPLRRSHRSARRSRRATDERTRAYYAETLPNPKLRVFPIAEVAAIGRPLGIPLIMDNTAAPLLCRPLEHGAAVVVYSTTKYIGGHGTSIGGMIVDGGNFDWEAHADRQPAAEHARSQLSRRGVDRGGQAAGPDRLHHPRPGDPAARPRRGAVAVQRLPVPAGPGDAAAAHPRGTAENAQAVADSRQAGATSTKVIHPSAADRRDAGAGRQVPAQGGYGGLVGFELAGGARRAAIHRRPEAVLPRRQHRRRAQPGDPSRQHHPLAAHRRRSRLATGVTDGYVRLSVGIEHIDDILADLAQALDAAG